MNLTHLMHKENRKRFSKLFIITTLSSCSLFSYAQQQQVLLTGNNLPLKEVFKQIEKQTNLSIDYKAKDIDDSQIITTLPNANTVEKVLAHLLNGTQCVATFNNGHVIIKKTVVQPAITQKQISGTVVDASGMPVIGANVMVKGTTNGTITDLDGKFLLEVKEGDAIEVSYIGYLSEEIIVGKKNVLSITLKEDTQKLDEVVVVGYGTMKKSDLTGSVTNLKADKILAKPSVNIGQALSGKASGVEIFENGGTPDGKVRIRIRGNNSINSSNDPLYVVDGVIGVNNISLLNPSEIESIEVLKDASATAIYGARGANGVIMVTTKRGLKGSKPLISYDGYLSIGKMSKKLDLMNASEWWQSSPSTREGQGKRF